MGWFRVVARGTFLGTLIFGGLALLLILRFIERPVFGRHRPWTPHITQAVCKGALVILGIRYQHHGLPMRGPGGVVANHSSWLDIFALNAGQRVNFVAKSEVSAWPVIGWLARATGTVFIERRARDARRQSEVFQERLRDLHRLLFFPEATSSDGQQVLSFKSTLFAAFLMEDHRLDASIQPVSVTYRAPPGQDRRFYGWWGDMDFGPHLLKILAAPKQGSVSLTYHAPLRVAEFADRKALAAACEAAVRSV